MGRLSLYLQEAIKGLGALGGGLGLFFVALFDSSFLSLPEINDLLILYFSHQFKDQAYYYALMAVLGSATGCTILYWIGRSKGRAFLSKKYSASRLETAFALFRKYGVLVVVGPAFLPPPFPFKIFVLSSGVFGLSFPRFITAVLVGRSFRYFFEAAVAARYGEQALSFIEENYLRAALVALVLLLVAFGAAVLLWRASRRQVAGA